MAAYVKFQQFNEDLGLGVHNLNTDTLRIYLTNNAPSVSADLVKADLVGITEENGYTPVDINNLYSHTAGVGTLTGDDVVITATTGTIGEFRYVVLYNDTSTLDSLICYWDYSAPITLQAGEEFSINFGVNIFTIT